MTDVADEPKVEMSPEEREWRSQVHMAILEETRIFLEENRETIQQRAVARLKAKADGKTLS